MFVPITHHAILTVNWSIVYYYYNNNNSHSNLCMKCLYVKFSAFRRRDSIIIE